MDSKVLKLNVLFNNKKYPVEAQPSSTVEALKVKISNEILKDIHGAFLKLIFRGKVLPKGCVLETLELEAGDTFLAVLAPSAAAVDSSFQIEDQTRHVFSSEEQDKGGFRLLLQQDERFVLKKSKDPVSLLNQEDVSDLLKRIQPLQDTDPGSETDFMGKGTTAQKQSKIKTVEMQSFNPDLRRLEKIIEHQEYEDLKVEDNYQPYSGDLLYPVSNITINFNQPMVPLTSIDELVNFPVPISVTPEAPGFSWSWADPSQAVYQHSDKLKWLPRSTKFTVRIEKGIKCAFPNVTLKNAFEYSFKTATPVMISNGPLNPEGLNPVCWMTFDQPIKMPVINVTVNGNEWPAEFVSDSETSSEIEKIRKEVPKDCTAILFRVPKLPKDSKVKATVPAGVQGLEGTLKSTKPFSFEFKTYQPLKAEKVVQRDYNTQAEMPYSPSSYFEITFTNSLHPSLNLDKKGILGTYITVSPPLPIQDFSYSVEAKKITIVGTKVADTSYKVALSPDLRDVYDQKITGTTNFIFTVKDAVPYKSFNVGGYSQTISCDPAYEPSIQINSNVYQKFHVYCYELDMKTDYKTYTAYASTASQTGNLPTFGKMISYELIHAQKEDGPQDGFKQDVTNVSLVKAFGASQVQDAKRHHVIVVAMPADWSPPPKPKPAPKNPFGGGYGGYGGYGSSFSNEPQKPPTVVKLVEWTPVTVVAFTSANNLYAWISSSVATQSQVVMQLVDKNGYTTEGTPTDENPMICSFALASGRNYAGLIVSAEKFSTSVEKSKAASKALGFLPSANWYYAAPQNECTWYVNTDRGAYRPEETVSVSGFFRMKDTSGSWSANSSGKLYYTVSDAVGNVIIPEKATEVKAQNSFLFDFKIPETANLGAGYVKVKYQSFETSVNFDIQEFRRPDFEISFENSNKVMSVLETNNITLFARQFSGGVIPSCDWTLTLVPRSFAPPYKYAPFTFASSSAKSSTYGPYTYTGATDKTGRHNLQMIFEELDSPMDVQIACTVKNSNRQSMSLNEVVTAYPVSAYVGIKVDKKFFHRGEKISGQVANVSPSGKAVGGCKITMFLSKIEFDQDTFKEREILVDEKEFTSEGQAEKMDVENPEIAVLEDVSDAKLISVPWEFDVKTAGKYMIRAVGHDEKGRISQTASSVWVYSPHTDAKEEEAEKLLAPTIPAVGPVVPASNVKVNKAVLDKDEAYNVGEEAELLILTTLRKSNVTIVIEKGGKAISVQQIDINSDSHVVKIPIRDDYIPSATVHAFIHGEADREIPAEYDGLLDKMHKQLSGALVSKTLRVSNQCYRLNVGLTAPKQNLLPGAQVTVTGTVRNQKNEPVQGAGVMLCAVDESVLAYAKHNWRDPLGSFYPSSYGRSNFAFSEQFMKFLTPKDLVKLKAQKKAAPAPVKKIFDSGISVVYLGGHLAHFDQIKMSDKVEKIKALIQERDGLAPWAQRLLYKGQQLDDGFTFNDYAIQAGEQIHLVIRLSGGGDDKNEAPPRPAVLPAVIRVRENYNPLAYIDLLETDSAGSFKATFKLPDNLTRYRIMAVAHTVKSFGVGQTKLTACLPLMVKPSPPRFLNFADQCRVSVIVYNQNDTPMKAKIAMRAYNCELSENGYSFVVPANFQSEIGFPVRATKIGKVRFQAVAAGFLEEINDVAVDACNFDFPVYAPNTTETFAFTSFVDDKEIAVQQPFRKPENTIPEFGHLEVVTSSTILQEAADAFIYVYEYPHFCSEQISSRLLSSVALKDVLKAFKTLNVPENELKSNIEQAINELETRQNNKGEFGFWKQGDTSYPYINIYVPFALAAAKANGFAVNATVIQNSKTYLSQITSKLTAKSIKQTDPYHHILTYFAAYVFMLLGGSVETAADLIDKFWPEDDEDLKSTATEMLVLALPVLFGAGRDVAPIAKELTSRLSTTQTRAYWDPSNSPKRDSVNEYWYFGTIVTNSLLLSALIKADETNKVIPKLVQGLNHAKAASRGRWTNTQDNCFALLAINDYFNTYERAQEPAFKTSIIVGERMVAEHAYSGFTTDQFSTKIPNQVLLSSGTESSNEGKQEDKNVPLFLVKEGPGRMYYRLAYQAALSNPFAPALDKGFTVTRSYEAMDDPKDVVIQKKGDETNVYIKAGARVRVDVNILNTTTKFYVALVDYLPGGLESLMPGGKNKRGWFSRDWWNHSNLRDARTEVYCDYLTSGIHTYSYVTRATSIGTFMAPPAKVEEMYEPECFGRSTVARVIVAETVPSQ